MADKKKNAQSAQRAQKRNATAEPKTASQEQEQPVKSSKEMTRDERKDVGAREKARVERKEPPRAENKTVRRDTKPSPTLMARVRGTRVGRFILDAYYELRHKVTWPTFEEARNMTFVVIALSAVIGGMLGLADLGLFQLFKLISGGR
jgi:preprotein translocase SecE subunit